MRPAENPLPVCVSIAGLSSYPTSNASCFTHAPVCVASPSSLRSRRSGWTSRHTSRASGHLEWNRQPEGGLIASGITPSIGLSSSTVLSGRGIESSSADVYGCFVS